VLDITIGGTETSAKVIALAVRSDGDDDPPTLVTSGTPLPPPLATEVGTFLADLDHPGSAGSVNVLPRPGRDPGYLLLVGVGGGDAAGWRSAGAALTRSASHRHASVTVRLPVEAPAVAARDLAEGAWLASYRFTLAAEPREKAPKLRRLVLTSAEPDSVETAIGRARAVTDAVILARDLTNTPSLQKSPKWLADRLTNAAARRRGINVTVLTEAELAQGGFGGILAIGGGSARPPRLVELSWRPRGARTHVVLVGKGVTFDTGGISLKPLEGMRLMRKDMGGAAAVCATVLGAADLNLPVRVTALAPLVENMVSGAAVRPGDVVRHYGGLTTEVQNTDAEGRVVLGDALAYAARRLKPDLIVDLATLTGASRVALGKRTAALFTHDDALAEALSLAGADVDERMWRMPLADEYGSLLGSDVADLSNAPAVSQAGAIAAALFLREFTGNLRDRWAHIDMSAPSWIEKNEGFLAKGATGWGVRMLLRWLSTL
jgi:leucyl aminopeptidase